jgi:hypothetical protein
MYQQQHSHQQQQLEYPKAEIDRINRQNAEEKKRAQLKEIIPAYKFIDSNTGQFNEVRFQNELEKRVKSNMTVEEIAEMYDVDARTCNNNDNNNNNNNNNNNHRY